MNLSDNLHITPKGEDEIKRRVYKLDMKKRSLLILLDKPQTIDHLIKKTVLHIEEFLAEINTLIQEGFVASGGDAAVSRASAGAPGVARSAPAAAGSAHIHVDDEVILSEAKFLLTDFSVDSFGTESQAFVDGIRACKNVKDLRLQLGAILAATEKLCPKQLPTLLNVIREINATA